MRVARSTLNVKDERGGGRRFVSRLLVGLALFVAAAALPAAASGAEWRPQGAYVNSVGNFSLRGQFVDITCKATLSGGPASGASLPVQLKPYNCHVWGVNNISASVVGKMNLIARRPSTNGEGGGDVANGETMTFVIPDLCTVTVTPSGYINGFARPFSQFGGYLVIDMQLYGSVVATGPYASFCAMPGERWRLYSDHWNVMPAVQIYP
jgi:hypothetical protein